MFDSACSINLDEKVITQLKELEIPESYLSPEQHSDDQSDQIENSTFTEHDSTEQTENSTFVDQDFADVDVDINPDVQTRFGRVVRQPDRLTY